MNRQLAVLLGAALALAGCSFSGQSIWPSLTASSSTPAPADGAVDLSGAPQVTPGEPTGTLVGEKIEAQRGELRRLLGQIGRQNQQLQTIRSQTVQNTQTYQGALAAMNARLEVGTTRRNPILVNQWTSAQAALARIDADVTQLHALANEVAGTATLSTYLLDTARATYGLTGAVDEDHRQLAVLENEVNRTLVLTERMLNEVNDDIQRQTGFLSETRAKLTALSIAIENGDLSGNRQNARTFQTVAPAAGARQASAAVASAAPAEPPAASPNSGATTNRPLVVIRFDRPNVAYEQALYSAVSRALERRPEATFDLVAVAPNRNSANEAAVASSASRRNAESVLRSLSEMGLPLDRVRLSATTSTVAAANEVHLFVR
jgi:hypothetical protein